MRAVRVAPVDPAQMIYSEWRFMLTRLKYAYLNGAGMSSQEATFGKIEGIVHTARWVHHADVQRLEVVFFILDFRAILFDKSATVHDLTQSHDFKRKRM